MQTQFFASSSASGGGSGTQNDPLTFAEVLSGAGGRIQPGHTVTFAAGTYAPAGNVTFLLNQIHYQAAAGALVNLCATSGVLLFTGTGNIFERLIFRGLPADRYSDEASSAPDDISIFGATVSGANLQFLGCIMIDLQNWFVGATALNHAEKDCVKLNTGWDSSADRGHGHHNYNQPNSSSSPIVLDTNIYAQGWGYGIHGYGTSVDIVGEHLRRVIVLDPRNVIGTNAPHHAGEVVIDQCVFLGAAIDLGYNATDLGALAYTNNYMAAGGVTLRNPWSPYTNSNNTLVSSSANATFVFPCSTPGLVAMLGGHNGAQAATVTFDVSGLGMVQGQSYRLRFAQNPFNTTPTGSNNVIDFTYDGSGSITVPTSNITVAQAYGYTGQTSGYLQTDVDLRYLAWRLEAL